MADNDGGRDAAEEILQLTHDALNLAQVGVQFDREENYAGAYDYYDKCILNIDEVMSKLPPLSEQWKKLRQIRVQYDERMDILKEIESNRNSFFKSSSDPVRPPAGSSSNTSGSSSSGRFGLGRRKMSADELNFSEIDISTAFEYEQPPPSITEIPYWILRNVKRSIISGGFITEGFFVPKQVWTQTDHKFSGIAAKTAAFDILIRIVNQLEPLPMSADEKSLTALELALLNATEELNQLQNHLSKPFPYIKEIAAPLGDGDGFASAEHSSHDMEDASGSNTPTTTGGRVPVSGGGSGGMSRDSLSSASPKPKSTGRTISSMVSTLSRHVRKYAEVGLARLSVALPSKLTSEELAEYTGHICLLCDKSQLFATWFRVMVVELRVSLVQRGQESGGDGSAAALMIKVDNILQALMSISAVMRDVFCEILLRDIENLLDRHVLKTRKSFSRMYWDQEQGADGGS